MQCLEANIYNYKIQVKSSTPSQPKEFLNQFTTYEGKDMSD